MVICPIMMTMAAMMTSPVNFGPDGPRTNIISMSTEKYIVVKAFFDAGKSQ